LHPEALIYRSRIAKLREELQDTFNERIYLSFELFPRLRDRYAERFGDLEHLMQERTLEMSERRRMVELFSLKLDRGQKLDMKTVDLVMKAVRNEFARVRSRMQAAFSAQRRKEVDDAWRPSPFIEHGREGAGNASARRRADELRELYRMLVKRLHPDARRSGGLADHDYWNLVQRGYLLGDLPLLRTLAHLVETLGEGESGATLDPFSEERRLRSALRAEQAQIDSLRRDDIYQMRDELDNDRWVSARRAAMQADVDALEIEIAKCDRFLAPILSGQKAPPPEIVKSIWSSFVEDMYINSR
jgi:hypothetical protein